MVCYFQVLRIWGADTTAISSRSEATHPCSVIDVGALVTLQDTRIIEPVAPQRRGSGPSGRSRDERRLRQEESVNVLTELAYTVKPVARLFLPLIGRALEVAHDRHDPQSEARRQPE